MIIINNTAYTPIFAEMAEFLVDKSTFDVYYVDGGSEMVKLTNNNAEEFINRFKGSRKRGICENVLYMVQKLPELSIKIDKKGYKVDSSYRGFDFTILEDKVVPVT